MGETVADTASDVVQNAASGLELKSIIPVIKDAVTGVFEIAGSGFNFLFQNPLCAFMIGSGFAFSALGLVRKALKTAKRA